MAYYRQSIWYPKIGDMIQRHRQAHGLELGEIAAAVADKYPNVRGGQLRALEDGCIYLSGSINARTADNLEITAYVLYKMEVRRTSPIIAAIKKQDKRFRYPPKRT